jgi:hypothetical protein
MSEKVSKALKEVWEWKEACYQEIKDLSPKERIAHINGVADRVLKEQGLEKVPVGDGTYRLREKNVGVVSEEQETYHSERK